MKKIPGNVVIMVFTTVPKRSDAIRLSQVIVKKKISACATILPGVRSFYQWERKMVEGKEVMIIFKTTMRRYPTLEKTIKALHPYEVPEILAVEIKNGYSPYVAWVTKEVIH